MTTSTRLIIAVVARLALGGFAFGQTTASSTPVERLDFGAEGLVIPPATIVNTHTPRTAQLLGEAYRRNDPLVWKRVQYIAEMGEAGLGAAAPFVSQAMKDPAPQVRAEAARAAAMIDDPSLCSGDIGQRAAATRALGELANPACADAVMKMLADPHPTVRREAIIALGKLADATTAQPRAIAMLGDPDPTVRQGAATVLTPMPTTAALAALAAQLDQEYAPLHQALREALAHPADATTRQA